MLTCCRLNLCSLLILSVHILVEAKDVCSGYNTCNHVYLKMEEALINNKTMLDKLRVAFLITNNIEIDFFLDLQVVNGIDNISCNCRNDYYGYAFYLPDTFDNKWMLCDPPMYFEYRTVAASKWKLEQTENDVKQSIEWMSYLHSSLWSTFIVLFADTYNIYIDSGFYRDSYDMTFRIDRLDCNPSPQLLNCVLSRLLSWVSPVPASSCILVYYYFTQIKVYAEVGGRPQTWDQSQKGTVTYNDDDKDMKFLKRSMHERTFVNLSLAEYVFVSLSLALVIARFFPAIHNQIVSKATTSLQYQSLFWGTAVVSNVFIYGLLFTAGKGLSIYMAAIFNPVEYFWYNIICMCVSSILEVIICVILFVGALISSMRSHPGIPIPTTMAKVMINISLCFSCFCLYVCCSSRCRAKTLHVLVLFSFMCFIYRAIMESISVGFLLFIEEYRTSTVSVNMLCISLVFFLVVFVSYSIFFMSSSRNVAFYQQGFNCLGGACMLVTVFGAVILLVVMYIIIFFSLKLTGVSGIVTGLIPSIALSAVSWYIKKRLQKADQSNAVDNVPPPITQSEYGATDARPMNDGGRENSDIDAEKNLLLP